MNKHVVWDYEDSVIQYYHIYGLSDEGDSFIDNLTDGGCVLTVVTKRTEVLDKLVDNLVDTINLLIENIDELDT